MPRTSIPCTAESASIDETAPRTPPAERINIFISLHARLVDLNQYTLGFRHIRRVRRGGLSSGWRKLADLKMAPPEMRLSELHRPTLPAKGATSCHSPIP
jgi:hypothetical protein